MGTAIVYFSDRTFRVFFTCDIDEAYERMWVPPLTSSGDNRTKEEQRQIPEPGAQSTGLHQQRFPATSPEKKGDGEKLRNKDIRPVVDDSVFEIFLT